MTGSPVAEARWSAVRAGSGTSEVMVVWHPELRTVLRRQEYGLQLTTVSAMMGHTNPSFTLACYGRDPRDEKTIVADVLARAASAGIGR